MGFPLKLLPKPKPMSSIDSSISNGAELAGVIAVFFLIGLGLDTWLGTTPWLMVCLSLFGMIGQFTKMYFAYTERMKELERHRSEAARGVGQ